MSLLKPTLLAGLMSVAIIASPVTRADDIAAIVRDYDAYNRAQDPIRAAQRGDLAAARRWPDDSPAAVTQRRQALLEFQHRLRAVEPAGLGPDDALNRELLVERVDLALEGLGFDEERMPFISGDGFYTTPDYAALNTRISNEATAEAWIARLEALPAYFATQTANMRRGLRTGLVQPQSTVERAIADIGAQLALAPDKSPLLAPFRSLPGSMPAARRASLEARGREVFEQKVRPAQRALLEFLRQEYLPHARPGIGIGTVPNGREYYTFLARRHTSTSMTPEQIHALGLQEVQRIRARMDEVIAHTGFRGDFQQFLASVRQDRRFYVSGAAYGEKASEVAKRADFLLPQYFGVLPRLTYGVRPMPAGLESSANGYLPGSPEQGVAGMVVYKPWMAEKMPTFGIAAWVLHEGVPGHHLQIALSQEMRELPEFRRADDVTAYVEGWALYSERLGEEMGAYRDPYEQFGRLSLEIWRACRLVIDTGMHVMGWSREQAVACLRDNSALAPTEIEFEVDRYIAWPGQALAYKIGELKIVELRERAATRLGEKFDLRAFHDLLLDSGAMPLDVLEARVDHWIATRASGTSAAGKIAPGE
jgi:uncharacterized protein (DUF885 family)